MQPGSAVSACRETARPASRLLSELHQQEQESREKTIIKVIHLLVSLTAAERTAVAPAASTSDPPSYEQLPATSRAMLGCGFRRFPQWLTPTMS